MMIFIVQNKGMKWLRIGTIQDVGRTTHLTEIRQNLNYDVRNFVHLCVFFKLSLFFNSAKRKKISI